MTSAEAHAQFKADRRLSEAYDTFLIAAKDALEERKIVAPESWLSVTGRLMMGARKSFGADRMDSFVRRIHNARRADVAGVLCDFMGDLWAASLSNDDLEVLELFAVRQYRFRMNNNYTRAAFERGKQRKAGGES